MHRLFLLLLISLVSIADIKFDGIIEESEWSDAEVFDSPFEILLIRSWKNLYWNSADVGTLSHCTFTRFFLYKKVVYKKVVP